jgi:hypothetical protein
MATALCRPRTSRHAYNTLSQRPTKAIVYMNHMQYRPMLCIGEHGEDYLARCPEMCSAGSKRRQIRRPTCTSQNVACIGQGPSSALNSQVHSSLQGQCTRTARDVLNADAPAHHPYVRGWPFNISSTSCTTMELHPVPNSAHSVLPSTSCLLRPPICWDL